MCVFKTFVIVTFLNEDFLSNTHTSFIDLPMCNYVSITLKTPHSKQVIYKLRIRNSPRQIRPRLLYLHLFRTENILSIRSSLRLLFIYIFAMVITYDNLFVIRYILLSLTIIDDKIHSLGETRPQTYSPLFGYGHPSCRFVPQSFTFLGPGPFTPTRDFFIFLHVQKSYSTSSSSRPLPTNMSLNSHYPSRNLR